MQAISTLFMVAPASRQATSISAYDVREMKVSIAAAFFLSGCSAWTQSNAITSSVKKDYQSIRDYFIRAAEKMPAAQYAFKPSPDVRTFAQQIAHVADDQYNLCSPALGEQRKAAYQAIEKSLSTKAELVPALKEAFAYCDRAYDTL